MKCDFICIKMKLMKSKKYLQQTFSWKVLVSQTTADLTSRVIKLCPFYMWIPYGNGFCADSSQVLQVIKQFLCFK